MSGTSGRRNRWVGLALAGFMGISLLAVYFWSMARSREDIDFLSHHAPAQWIVFPKPPTGRTQAAVEMRTTFRRSFVLDEIPPQAKVTLRAMKRWSLVVNGNSSGEMDSTNGAHWKKPATIDIAGQLRRGTNEVVVTVYNHTGPPALWFELEAGTNRVCSDRTWTTRLWDSTEYNAWPVAAAGEIRKGSRLYADERPFASLFSHWVLYVALAALAALGVRIGIGFCARQPAKFVNSADFTICVLAIPLALWMAMYCNNLRSLPDSHGFDALDHLDYIHYIEHRGAVPLANEGWQMYQPPLYYRISSLLVEIVTPTTVAGEIMTVRILGLFIGVIHFVLVFLSLRLIFPKRPGAQVVGLTVAALVPALIYISQYVTNESLAAMLTTAALYACLRIAVGKEKSFGMYVAVGLCLGAALLSKVTALIAVPFIAAALVEPAALKNFPSAKNWFWRVAASAAACLCICGPYYYRVWSRFGSPLIGNWDPSVGAPWWMEPGFRTSSYFFRFGECLMQPWYSGLSGFMDGLYSTLWGDGLWGGITNVAYRPPWNYHLMAAGFLLALVPSILVVLGFFAAAVRFVRAPERAWFLLLGVASAVFAALVYMNLKVAAYGEAKAFYGLIALLPLCACAGVGYRVLQRLGKAFSYGGAILVGVWAMNSYGSFWIRHHTPNTQIELALDALNEGREPDAQRHYAEAVRLTPGHIRAQAMMAGELMARGRADDAKHIAAQAVKNPLAHEDERIFYADLLAADGQFDAAVAQARKSIAFAPDDPALHDVICEWLCRQGRFAEAVSAGKEAERIDSFSPQLHFNLGFAMTKVGDETGAAEHFKLAAELKPEYAEAHDQLGLSLQALGHRDEAAEQFQQALRLQPQNATFQKHLESCTAKNGALPKEP